MVTPEPPRLPMANKDAEHLRLLAIFHYVVAAIGAVFACFPLMHVAMGVMMVVNPRAMTSGQAGAASPPAAFGYFFIAMGMVFVCLGWAMAICTFISGRLLARRRKRMSASWWPRSCACSCRLAPCSASSRSSC